MGIAEIILSGIIFIFIWFAIFKFKLIWDSKKMLKNIEKKLDKQEKVIYNDGKIVDMKKYLGLNKEETKEDIPKPEETEEKKEE